MEAAAAASQPCPTCKSRRYLIERQGDYAKAKKCSCAKHCSICDGNGYVISLQDSTFSTKVGAKRYDVFAPCSCRSLEERITKYNKKAGIPGVLAHATFEGYRPLSPGQDRAREVARQFAYGYVRGRSVKGFILSGPVGTGKTHLLAAALGHLVLEMGVTAQYVEISLLYTQIRNGFDQGKSGGEIIRPLSNVEVLAIDELGKGRGSPFELETLDELIARRYNAGRTTLFATNYPLEYKHKVPPPPPGTPPQQKPKEGENLLDRVNERIFSRLCEMCEFVQMPVDTPDERKAKLGP